MAGENFRDIMAFLAVAKESSFTRAASQLGVSQSALSHTVRGLEERLGIRLLTRTTRSVSPTEAGERLIERVAPRLDFIEQELAIFELDRNRHAGAIRLTASDFAMVTLLWPKLSVLQRQYPDIKFEIAIHPQLIDIEAEGYDAGIRIGDQVAKGMIATQVSTDTPMVIVGAPGYLAKRPAPSNPTELTAHDCLNTRFCATGDVCAWELSDGKQNVQVEVDGPWTFNCIGPVVDAALAGFGLAFVPRALVEQHLSDGQLIAVMGNWCPTFPALHLCYSNRRPLSSAMALVVEALASADFAAGASATELIDE